MIANKMHVKCKSSMELVEMNFYFVVMETSAVIWFVRSHTAHAVTIKAFIIVRFAKSVAVMTVCEYAFTHKINGH